MNISVSAQQALSQRTEQNHISFRSLACGLDPLGERTEFPKPHFYLKEIFLTFSQGHVFGVKVPDVKVPDVVISLQALQQAGKKKQLRLGKKLGSACLAQILAKQNFGKAVFR